jgi:hypothetical protein
MLDLHSIMLDLYFTCRHHGGGGLPGFLFNIYKLWVREGNQKSGDVEHTNKVRPAIPNSIAEELVVLQHNPSMKAATSNDRYYLLVGNNKKDTK